MRYNPLSPLSEQYHRAQTKFDNVVQGSLVLERLQDAGLMSSTRLVTRREELKDYYEMIVMHKAANKKAAARKWTSKTPRDI